ncbi:MAG: MlaD family protein [Treponema sp.]|nr:MlaD family protein [Treponema sp.]
MKLTIRFADQIVGALIILALGILVFAIFMLGSSQRWFSRDYNFKTYFNSASGLSQNMGVQYKGFTIGHVKSIMLDDEDRVEVHFTVFDTYIDRVKNGSLVEVLSSPIGGLGGGGLIFYPGKGTELVPEGGVIPAANSSEGKRLLALGLAERPEQDDSISNIINRAGILLGSLNDLIVEVQEAFEGTDRTSLGRTMGGLEQAISSVQGMAQKLPDDLEGSISKIVEQIEPILGGLRELSDKLSDPDGTVMSILDSEGDVYTSLASSLTAVSGTLQNLEKTSDFIPAQLPQVAGMLTDLNAALKTAEDLLVSLTNNPLLKRGLPERKETKVGGVQARDLDF